MNIELPETAILARQVYVLVQNAWCKATPEGTTPDEVEVREYMIHEQAICAVAAALAIPNAAASTFLSKIGA